MNENFNSEQQQKQPDFSFGKRLSSARNALNLSREEVSKELRLGLGIIKALEEEDCERLGAPIFVTGYLRNYAGLLKIPVEPLLAAYGKIQIEMPSLVSPSARKSKQSHNKLLIKTASLLFFLVLVAGIVSWFQNQDFELPEIAGLLEQAPDTVLVESSAALPALPELSEVVEPPVDVVTEVPIIEQVEPVGEVSQSAVVQVEPGGEARQPAVVQVEPGGEVSQPAVIEVKPVAAVEQLENKVSVSVKEDSWVEVTDNEGKRLIYDLLRADKEYTVSGRSPYKVFLGNAKGVRIEYNGELVNIEQYTQGNLARFKLGAAGE